MKVYDLNIKMVLIRIATWIFFLILSIIIGIYYFFMLNPMEQAEINVTLLIIEIAPIVLITGIIGISLELIKNLSIIFHRIKKVLLISENSIEYDVPFLGQICIAKDNVESVYASHTTCDSAFVSTFAVVICKNPIENFSKHKRICNFLAGILVDSSDDKVIRINLNDIKCNRDDLMLIIKEFDPYYSKKGIVINGLLEKYEVPCLNDLINNEIGLKELIILLQSECHMTQKEIASITNQKIKKVSTILRNLQ